MKMATRYPFILFVLGSYFANAQDVASGKLELCIKDSSSILMMPVNEILSQATSLKPSQTGGSVTALSATLGTSLFIMAFQISRRMEKDSVRKHNLNDLINNLKEELKLISCFVDRDKEIYFQFLAVGKLPAKTEKEKLYKDSCTQATLKNATVLPLDAAKRINAILKMAGEHTNLSSPKVSTDLNAATLILSSAEEGMLSFAEYNATNLVGNETKSLKADCNSIRAQGKTLVTDLLKKIPK